MKTNNPTIDGVSREFAERTFSALKRLSGHITVSDNDLKEGREIADELRTLLDAPSVERQEAEFPAGAIHNGRAFIDQLESIYAFKEQQGHPLSLCSEWQELVRCFEWLAAHATAQQSTIARLEARIVELESGRGEPALFVAEESIGDAQCVGMHATRKANDLQCVPLFTAPPAPVAVVLNGPKP